LLGPSLAPFPVLARLFFSLPFHLPTRPTNFTPRARQIGTEKNHTRDHAATSRFACMNLCPRLRDRLAGCHAPDGGAHWGPFGVLPRGRAFCWNQTRRTAPRPPTTNGEPRICFAQACHWLTGLEVLSRANQHPHASAGSGSQYVPGYMAQQDPPRLPARGTLLGHRRPAQDEEKMMRGRRRPNSLLAWSPKTAHPETARSRTLEPVGVPPRTGRWPLCVLWHQNPGGEHGNDTIGRQTKSCIGIGHLLFLSSRAICTTNDSING
jgi:hypothetical protein